jgi:ABC-type branched-subunit amino acid transport system permease subunit
MRTVLPFAVFALFLGLWTWKLLEPSPLPESVAAGLSGDWKFWLAKFLHAGAYAFLTVLARWLPLRRGHFWLAVALLALHGAVTEFLQRYLDWGRNGCVRDVIVDCVGIGVGLLFLHQVRLWPSSSPPTHRM